MISHDSEIEHLRLGVSCAAVLEQFSPGWLLDAKQSTRGALKYRRGAGEVLIVNHDGRGWWDTQSAAKGDVFALVQHLDPHLNFGQVRQALRPFVGMTPNYPALVENRARSVPDRPLPERWSARPRLRHGSPAWTYLTVQRQLPVNALHAADAADVLRDGAYGSAWFAHRDGAGGVSHIEIRGPDFKGSVRGGSKTLFRLPARPGTCCRLVIVEAPIDALSIAALEGIRPDTNYLATGGGMGPRTLAEIERALAGISSCPTALLASATDANSAGDRYATQHAELAAAAGVPFARLRPTLGSDWNDELRQGRGV